ncbi:hypothetical protein BOX15_Mlig012838g9 [Macrostomum lignano]|uniref:Uncharacterized protein n=1 Tax=Macrostomum lignano TaxID=282301 RepID=A0A267H3A6_9PLAT|nr:hypothetical protein BOX15_Mlig012838g6 [Macrostomum lignano]PAA73118.1 hypothetical protein BOX15_Mlig012838g1 [Macrostomum lignano]PAA80805.1 hypothetical protein BOX15_Mlig020777g2 [Macrostomum lignano]PAA89298.1 hypothetical protein BOX15_Mlig012838g3 [Macrostomum lignano]PAA92790.1 hypothetical protein BOX15_Mlig012838g9 [Macrostomum lignano]
MPNAKKSHEECRESLCLLCLRKASRSIWSVANFSAEDLVPNFASVQHILPTGLCDGCRRIISSLSGPAPRELPPRLNYEQMVADLQSLPPSTRNNPHCSCELCELARSKNSSKLTTSVSSYSTGAAASRPGRPRKHPLSAADAAQPQFICSFCRSEIGRGKKHNCSRATRLTNLQQGVSPDTQDMLASSCISTKAAASGSSCVSLSRMEGGRPMRVTVGASVGNGATSFPATSISTMKTLKGVLNLSNNQTLQVAQVLRAGASSSRAVESRLKDSLVTQNRVLEDFFKLKTLQFELSSSAIGDRAAVLCTDASRLIEFIVQQRGASNFECRLGLDGGGGFFKICVSVVASTSDHQVHGGAAAVHESVRRHSQFNDAGVKKIIVLAIVNDISETYKNVKTLLQAVSVVELSAVTVTDMKLANILCGLQPHSCAHPCPYCESTAPLTTSGRPRTLGRIRQKVQEFNSAGRVWSRAKQFMNCVNLPLLAGDDDEEVLMLLPPPELHLLLGISNKLLDSLNEAWGEDRGFAWLQSHGIVRAGYRGGTMEGNACRKLLLMAEVLLEDVPHELQPFAQCLICFNSVVNGAFGQELVPDFGERIENFGAAYLALGLTVTPKVHVLLCHVSDFCHRTGRALGTCSEQAVESAHSDFQRTWQRYRLPADHPQFGNRLLQATVAYNSWHI